MSGVELASDEASDVVAAGFVVKAGLCVSEGDEVRVEEESHLTLCGTPHGGSVKTIFKLSRQWSDPVAVTVWTSIGCRERQPRASRRIAQQVNPLLRRAQRPLNFSGAHPPKRN